LVSVRHKRADNNRLEETQEESKRQLRGRLPEAERQTKKWKDQYFELEAQMEEESKI
jgi:molecular chaperone GrpE (heat shock protein)